MSLVPSEKVFVIYQLTDTWDDFHDDVCVCARGGGLTSCDVS